VASRSQASTWNLVIAGVGGQGVILLNAVLGRAAAGSGLEVATAETHGMAQRYGRVMIHLRIGVEVHGTLIPRGGADVLLGMEPLETLRSVEFCSGNTLVLMNRQVVRPPSLAMSWHEHYPSLEEIERRLARVAGRVLVFDARQLAWEAGAVQATNAVMLGALCASSANPVAPEVVRDTLLEVVPPKATDINRKAFDLGGAWVQVSQGAECLGP
jgi:indolepyruvate ferredoxin oxidoreductase beta subunit